MTKTLECDLAEAVQGYLETHTDQMEAVLEALVGAESPTHVTEAQVEVQEMLSRLLRTLGFEVVRVPGGENTGDHLFARPTQRRGDRPVQLLVGHCDTVWDRGTLEEMPFVVEGNQIRGPGVFDMKGGLVQMIFAVAALRAIGAPLEVTPVVFINSDGEQGSRTSPHHLRRLARCANRAFILEPALGLDGKIKTSRKGGGRFIVDIHGESAHAGLDPDEGSSAILELSHIVQRLHALNDPEAGISVNVATIGGGTRPNVVADEGRAEVDVRIRSRDQAEQVEKAVRRLDATTPGTQVEIEGSITRLPMEPTLDARRLWEQAQKAAACLGVELDEGRSDDVSDGNTTSQYAPTLDGLGAVGGEAHARHEFCYLDKMVERSVILGVLLAQPALPESSTHASVSEQSSDVPIISLPSLPLATLDAM